MAEFKEVVKEAKRMCAQGCVGCSCEGNGVLCNIVSRFHNIEFDPEKIEEIVMKWAKDHPRRRYPTWREWGKAICMIENAPPLLPCHFIDCSRKDLLCPNPCPYLDNEIPAEFAQKANIRPLENKKEGFVLD